MQKRDLLHLDEAKLIEIEAAVASGEIKIYPKPPSNNYEAFSQNERPLHKVSKRKAQKKAKKSQETNFTARVYKQWQVESTNSAVLILDGDSLAGIKLELGLKLLVNGTERVISNITYHQKKNQVAIATRGYGPWPLGMVGIVIPNKYHSS